MSGVEVRVGASSMRALRAFLSHPHGALKVNDRLMFEATEDGGVVVMMGLLTLLPTLVLMMTGFTRIVIVLGVAVAHYDGTRPIGVLPDIVQSTILMPTDEIQPTVSLLESRDDIAASQRCALPVSASSLASEADMMLSSSSLVSATKRSVSSMPS